MRHQQMVESNRVHSKRMILVKKEQILQKDWMDAFDEWHQSIKCIEECFSILFPSVYSHPNNNRSDDRSDESACILPAVKGSTTVKAAVEEEEEVESDESLDEDVAMSPYHQDESGVEWVEGDDDDDDAHGDGHGDQDDDDDNNQKTKSDKFNANDDVDHHHLSTRQAYDLEEEDEDEEEFYGDESMPTGAVPYSLVSMLISS